MKLEQLNYPIELFPYITHGYASINNINHLKVSLGSIPQRRKILLIIINLSI